MVFLKIIVRLITDFALPPRCPGCGEIVIDPHRFCLSCWQSLDFLDASGCNACGLPVGDVDLTCGACLAKPPIHDGVFASVGYGIVARNTILKFKYGGKIGLAHVLAQGLLRHVPQEPEAILVPVPLYRWRLWHRGFNQSAIVAKLLAKSTANPCALDVLTRHRKTPPLGTLNPQQREKAVSGAFSISAKQQGLIKGRDVLLVDDVYTTGATANACAKELKRAGAKSVKLLCWARVIPEK